MSLHTKKLSEELFTLIQEMYSGKYGSDLSKKIQDDIRQFIRNKEELIKDPDYPKALRVLVSLIITKSFWRTSFLKVKEFDDKFNDFIYKYPDFKTSEAEEELLKLAQEVTPFKDTIPKVSLLLSQLRNSSIWEWSDELNRSLDTFVLGPKGRDNYLRDFGWWDRVPMDRHEMRFIIRTGMFHAFINQGFFDPLEKEDLHLCLSKFCLSQLKEKRIDGIDLGISPGIVDLFIWRFCAKGTKNEPNMGICGKNPRCDSCPLSHCQLRISGLAYIYP